jgi:hypothetical protein
MQVYGKEVATRYAGGMGNNYVNPTLLIERGNKPFLTWYVRSFSFFSCLVSRVLLSVGGQSGLHRAGGFDGVCASDSSHCQCEEDFDTHRTPLIASS